MSAAPKHPPARASRKRFFILPVQSFTEELGERISAARRCCKLTQEELAQKSRTSLSTYQEAAKEPRTQAKSVRRKKDSTSKKATKTKKTTRSVKS